MKIVPNQGGEQRRDELFNVHWDLLKKGCFHGWCDECYKIIFVFIFYEKILYS